MVNENVKDPLDEIIQFMLFVDQLKKELRETSIIGRSRRENVAEHAWHVAIFAFLLQDHMDADMCKVIRMLLIHDLAEIVCGDIYTHSVSSEERMKSEKEGFARVMEEAPAQIRSTITDLWNEFNERETREAQVAHSIDRAHPILMNIENGGDVWLMHKTNANKVRDHMIDGYVRDGNADLHRYLHEAVSTAEEKGCFPK